MEDAARELPRPIRIAVGFLIADAFWVVLMLGLIGRRLDSSEAATVAVAPVVAGFVWVLFAVGSIVGLARRSIVALSSAIVLTMGSALLVGAPLILKLWNDRSLPLAPPTLFLLGGLACFLTPMILFLAGRRDYLARC